MSGKDVEAALEELKINVSESGKEEMNPVDWMVQLRMESKESFDHLLNLVTPSRRWAARLIPRIVMALK